MLFHIYGYELLGAALASAFLFRRKGSHRYWLVSVGVLAVLSLGPYLKPSHFPLPFALLGYLWPSFLHFRTPYRLMTAATIGLAILAGFVLHWLLARIPSRALAVSITALLVGGRVLVEVNLHPFALQVYPVYSVYEQIARETGDFAILEVPVGVRSGFTRFGNGGEVLQYYQQFHGKPIVNGMIARLPDSVFEFYKRHPSLVFLSGGNPLVTPEERREDLFWVLDRLSCRYVLLHTRFFTELQSVDIEAFLDRHPQLERMGMEADLVIYRVRRGNPLQRLDGSRARQVWLAEPKASELGRNRALRESAIGFHTPPN